MHPRWLLSLSCWGGCQCGPKDYGVAGECIWSCFSNGQHQILTVPEGCCCHVDPAKPTWETALAGIGSSSNSEDDGSAQFAPIRARVQEVRENLLAGALATRLRTGYSIAPPTVRRWYAGLGGAAIRQQVVRARFGTIGTAPPIASISRIM
jgi:hypothetical protein